MKPGWFSSLSVCAPAFWSSSVSWSYLTGSLCCVQELKRSRAGKLSSAEEKLDEYLIDLQHKNRFDDTLGHKSTNTGQITQKQVNCELRLSDMASVTSHTQTPLSHVTFYMIGRANELLWLAENLLEWNSNWPWTFCNVKWRVVFQLDC